MHVWHNLFDIDSLNFCCIGNFFSGTQFNCDRFLLLSHWICSLRNFQQAIWILGPVINMPVPRFTWFLRMEIVQPKGDSFTKNPSKGSNSLQEVSHWITSCSVWISMIYIIPMYHCVPLSNSDVRCGLWIYFDDFCGVQIFKWINRPLSLTSCKRCEYRRKSPCQW